MANAFDGLAARMDRVTAKRLGRPVLINGISYISVESHLIPELGPVSGDEINLVIFGSDYQASRGDVVIYLSQQYQVTRFLLFNGKLQIWIEETDDVDS